jgi:conjugal transfer pilus assembly protein TraV
MEDAMKTLLRCTPLALVALMLGACTNPIKSSKFQCPHPEGVSCMSTLEVYEHTEHADRVTGSSPGKPAPHVTNTREAWGHPARPQAQAAVVIEDGVMGLMDSLDPAPATTPAPTSEPLLTPAKVLRIWLAPWEDSRGDLHLAGYVFSEVEGRRWRVGQTPPASQPTFRLISAPAATAAAPATK